MANLTLPPINVRDLPGFIRGVATVFDEASVKKEYLQPMANLMLNMISVRFSLAKDADGNAWKSTASNTRFGGRFSTDYKRRPSGKEVTSGSKRLTDTGELMKSYKILYITGKKVVVGPTGARNTLIATVATEKWNNEITGWGKKDTELAIKEFEAYMNKKLRKL